MQKRLPVLCRKTKACKFHLEGRCTRGSACNFAHSPAEVNMPPDLNCTKLCEALVTTGRCGNPQCHFAHSQEELRKFPSVRGSAKKNKARTPIVLSLAISDDLVKESECDDMASTYLSENSDMPSFSRQISDETVLSSLSESSSDAGSESPLAAPLTDPPALPADTPARQTKLSQQLRKTKLCTFHEQGRCKRGRKCTFAHSGEELQPKPQLASTKMCAKLRKNGRCGDPNCTYAHHPDELQLAIPGDNISCNDQAEPGPEEEADQRHVVSAASALEIGGAASHPAEEPLSPACVVEVKNTFITVVTKEQKRDRIIASQRRRGSAPAYLVRLAVATPGNALASHAGDQLVNCGGGKPSLPGVADAPLPPHRKSPGFACAPALRVPALL